MLDLARTMNDQGGFDGLGDALLTIQGGGGGDSLGSRRILVRDVAQLIITAIDRPTLLVFEDLQWADELSVEVVGELARIGQDRPLLLLGAYRADELRSAPSIESGGRGCSASGSPRRRASSR